MIWIHRMRKCPNNSAWWRVLDTLRHDGRKREEYYNRVRRTNPLKPGDWVLYSLDPQSKAADYTLSTSFSLSGENRALLKDLPHL